MSELDATINAMQGRIDYLEQRRDTVEANLRKSVAELREINFNWQVRDELREAENRRLRALVERGARIPPAYNFGDYAELIVDCQEEVEKWEKK